MNVTRASFIYRCKQWKVSLKVDSLYAVEEGNNLWKTLFTRIRIIENKLLKLSDSNFPAHIHCFNQTSSNISYNIFVHAKIVCLLTDNHSSGLVQSFTSMKA